MIYRKQCANSLLSSVIPFDLHLITIHPTWSIYSSFNYRSCFLHSIFVLWMDLLVSAFSQSCFICFCRLSLPFFLVPLLVLIICLSHRHFSFIASPFGLLFGQFSLSNLPFPSLCSFPLTASLSFNFVYNAPLFFSFLVYRLPSFPSPYPPLPWFFLLLLSPTDVSFSSLFHFLFLSRLSPLRTYFHYPPLPSLLPTYPLSLPSTSPLSLFLAFFSSFPTSIFFFPTNLLISLFSPSSSLSSSPLPSLFSYYRPSSLPLLSVCEAKLSFRSQSWCIMWSCSLQTPGLNHLSLYVYPMEARIMKSSRCFCCSWRCYAFHSFLFYFVVAVVLLPFTFYSLWFPVMLPYPCRRLAQNDRGLYARGSLYTLPLSPTLITCTAPLVIH